MAPQAQRRGDPRIYQRGNRWRVCWFRGKQHERSFTSEREAKDFANSLRVAKNLDSVTGPDAMFGSLVAKAIDPAGHPSWGVNFTASMESAARNHVIPALGDLRCKDVTPEKVGAFLRNMAVGRYSKSSISKAKHVIVLAVRVGKSLGCFDSNSDPMIGIRMPDAVGKSERLVPIDESELPTEMQVEALIKAMDEESEMHGVMARIAAGSGVRWGELLALTSVDFDFEKRRIRIWRQIREENSKFIIAPPKTKRSNRRVMIPTKYVDQIKDYVESRPEGEFLFTTGNGTPFSRSNWNSKRKKTDKYSRSASKFVKSKEAAGWGPHLTWHSLRHFFATQMLREGISYADVSAMLGHASTDITFRIYVRDDGEAVERATAIL